MTAPALSPERVYPAQSGQRSCVVETVDDCAHYDDLAQAISAASQPRTTRIVIPWPDQNWSESRLLETLRGVPGHVQVVVDDPDQRILDITPWSNGSIMVRQTGRETHSDHGARTCSSPAESPSWQRWLVGESAAMRRIRETIRIVANRKTTVLLQGETGSGKELVAKALHEASNRRHKDMVALNCAAIPESLIEAELFGHSKGAYTGAVSARAGYFERAQGSTLLLDEIGEMPLALQGKLLRVLQEREVQPIGSTNSLRVDCRVVAASNLDLEEEACMKRFRSDLYYRLSVVVVRLPPLRERLEDIPRLASFFMDKICRTEDMPDCRLTPGALDRLMSYDWPGNIRQLEHCIESALILADGKEVLTPDDIRLPENSSRPTERCGPRRSLPTLPSSGTDLGEEVKRLEAQMLGEALDLAHGNKARAASLLGLKRTTLLYKARTLGIAVS